jgi:hypothetical protein
MSQSGQAVIPCEHIKSGDYNNLRDTRTIQAGKNTIFVLCPYCDGRLTKTILDDYVKTGLKLEIKS